ncbi:MAG: EamA family transporter, partial [Opitutales bacterium]|nr:EamA family transporter [Opitutales bacterium]
AMILAVLVWPESETMSGGFYIGAAIVVAMIFINALVSKRRAIV